MNWIKRLTPDSETVPPSLEPHLRTFLFFLLTWSLYGTYAEANSWTVFGLVLTIGLVSCFCLYCCPDVLFSRTDPFYAPGCIFSLGIITAVSLLGRPLSEPSIPLFLFLADLFGVACLCLLVLRELDTFEHNVITFFSLLLLLNGTVASGPNLSLSWFVPGLLLSVFALLSTEMARNAAPKSPNAKRTRTPRGNRESPRSRTSSNRKNNQTENRSPSIVSTIFSGLSLTILALVPGLLLFFLFPRISWFMSDTRNGKKSKSEHRIGSIKQTQVRTTGSTPDQLKLQDLTRLKASLDPVLRVKVREENNNFVRPERPLYLRSRVYTTYSNGTWKTDNEFQTKKTNPMGQWSTFPPAHNPDVSSAGYRTMMVDVLRTRDEYLPLPYGTAAVKCGNPYFKISPGGEFRVPSENFPSKYRVRFAMMTSGRRRYPSVDPETVQEKYANVTPGSLKQAFRDTSRNIVPEGKSIRQTARTIEKHLRSEPFEYTLKFDGAGQRDPILEFVTRKKRGYCTQFASAMVLLLRSLDIPARLVGGFVAREWSDNHNALTVRSRHAHAWVEVHDPSDGWLVFDPTPAEAFDPGANNLTSTSGNGQAEDLETVVGEDEPDSSPPEPDADKDTSLGHYIQNYGKNPESGPVDLLTKLAAWMSASPWIFLILLVPFAFLIWVFLFSGQDAGTGDRLQNVLTSESDPGKKILQQLRKSLRDQGHTVKRSDTPREWIDDITNPSIAKPAYRVVQAYYKFRFGNRSLSEDQLEELLELARRSGMSDQTPKT